MMEARVNDDGVMSDADSSLREVGEEAEVDQELTRRLERLSAELASKPLKQIIPILRRGKHPGAIRFVENYDRQLRRQREISRQVKKELEREKKAAEQAAPETAVKTERSKRLAALERATKYRRGDKLIEQLLGREEELSIFWAAGKLAALEVQSRAPSDKEIAIVFKRLSGKPCSRHQARSKRQIVERLNQHPGVWLSLEVSS